MKIIHKEIKENHLFNRKEVKVTIEEKITPSNSKVEEFLSREFSLPSENIKIIKIAGKFGSDRFIITANIYHSKEDREKTEPKEKKKKGSEETKTEEKKQE